MSRFDEIHNLTCSGLDVTPLKAIVGDITLNNKYECALLSANFIGFANGDIKKWSVKFKTIPSQGELYRHAGKWSSTEDNVIQRENPIYRPFTMGSQTDYATLELEIVDETGTAVTGNIAYGASYFTIHIRHAKDQLQNEFITAVSDACALIETACDTVASNVNLCTVSTDAIKASVDSTSATLEATLETIKTSADNVKASVDLCTVSTDAIKASVDSTSATLEATLETIKTSTDAVESAVDLCTVSTDAIKASVDSTSATLEATLETIKTSTDAVKASVDLVTVSTDSLGSTLTGIESAVDEHRVVSTAMSAKIRYNLLY
jgi:hypothetical protein